MWAPRGFGDLEISAFCFQVAGKHWKLFQGFEEQPHSSGDLGSPAKSKKMNLKKNHLKGKAYISFDFIFKNVLSISMIVIDQTQ